MTEPMSLEALIAVDGLLSEEERMVQSTVRRFVKERYLPRAADLFAKEQFATDLIPEMAELGLLGASLTGYGCAGMTPAAYGLALEELEFGDSGLRSFASVQGSLAMYPIWKFGSDAQKEKFLPGMAKGELIGCFGLTEPDAGSDPASMKTHAKRDGKDWILNGTKMWITSSPVSHLAVVWAKTGDDAKSVRGFIVERGMKGFETPTVHGKMSLRASPTGEIVLSDVRVPEENVLPKVEGMRGPLSCLTQARFGISFGALGAARACLECVVDYTRTRIAFGRPIAEKQLVQKKIVDMAVEIAKGKIMAVHFAKLKEKTGDLHPAQVSLCKKNNVGIAIEAAR
ncbi:MAG TPA: acyl-CoA dehydrogenase family protein, partial [Polyangiaceae bacterium]|nr:acyl-CoA dehydrogenase family protein [Polyangiaceae bacterium]